VSIPLATGAVRRQRGSFARHHNASPLLFSTLSSTPAHCPISIPVPSHTPPLRDSHQPPHYSGRHSQTPHPDRLVSLPVPSFPFTVCFSLAFSIYLCMPTCMRMRMRMGLCVGVDMGLPSLSLYWLESDTGLPCGFATAVVIRAAVLDTISSTTSTHRIAHFPRGHTV
jgi:hypothetical protein